jgi:NAD(P)-dependent dehydrogenase (short-subunit alcohol dehydrogenase family)
MIDTKLKTNQMDLQLKSKTAFISGSTQGIGFAIAKKLLEEGANVLINGRYRDKVSSTVEKLKLEFPGSSVTGITADFSKADEVSQLVDQLPGIDILVNNVGVFKLEAFTEITDQQWTRFFEINVMSGVRLSRAILPKMLAANSGRIIFISSESGVKIPADMIHYGMTKAAMIAVARGLAELTKGSMVTVNTILGGPVYSDGVAGVISQIAASAQQELEPFKDNLFKSLNPGSLLQRFIEPAELANLAVYLASPLSSATNGAALRADGGLLQSIL